VERGKAARSLCVSAALREMPLLLPFSYDAAAGGAAPAPESSVRLRPSSLAR